MTALHVQVHWLKVAPRHRSQSRSQRRVVLQVKRRAMTIQACRTEDPLVDGDEPRAKETSHSSSSSRPGSTCCRGSWGCCDAASTAASAGWKAGPIRCESGVWIDSPTQWNGSPDLHTLHQHQVPLATHLLSPPRPAAVTRWLGIHHGLPVVPPLPLTACNAVEEGEKLARESEGENKVHIHLLFS
ncbi:hypothetical protein AAFF_G00091250 [Aldrovandia affinis]|uniref:Uncharacterized protein n=1 Tax=Aldrovandia affinis TaxID=143900 RepID=A0AAD7RWA4_9TELE|nr:hypothetical protein AAFF_G00091250 [Aldrovandia affinis]